MFSFHCGCYFCGQRLVLASHGICSVCLRRLPQLPICCPRCGLPAGSGTKICGRCEQQSPPWQHMVAVSDYQGVVKELILKFKFQRYSQFTRLLARLLLLCWLEKRRQIQLVKPTRLITVPLHRVRRWRRGFNQTEYLAEYLSRWLGCCWDPLLLTRNRATRLQQRLTAAERKRNLSGVFTLNGSVEGEHIAVLDDIVTTGSTLAEISRLLLYHGAASVQAWCVCRTL